MAPVRRQCDPTHQCHNRCHNQCHSSLTKTSVCRTTRKARVGLVRKKQAWLQVFFFGPGAFFRPNGPTAQRYTLSLTNLYLFKPYKPQTENTSMVAVFLFLAVTTQYEAPSSLPVSLPLMPLYPSLEGSISHPSPLHSPSAQVTRIP